MKICSRLEAAIYHAMSRSVNGEFYFASDADKEEFCRMLWLIAEYCGVQVLTFVVMANHFHIELLIPLMKALTDEELLRRYALLHPPGTSQQSVHLEAIRDLLQKGGPEAEEWRQSQLRQMGDLSQFMKLLKQRFSIRFNRTHRRYGTLWSERFKSVLMEGQDREEASLCTAVYIDLNPVRAGLVRDPKDYRFCGYGAAVGGDERARKGIMLLTGAASWPEAQAIYRTMLFAAGAERAKSGRLITPEELAEVVARKGTLPLADVLLCRTRYLTNTLVLGSRAFVERHLDDFRRRTGARLRAGPRPLPAHADWGSLFALRRPRASA